MRWKLFYPLLALVFLLKVELEVPQDSLNGLLAGKWKHGSFNEKKPIKK